MKFEQECDYSVKKSHPTLQSTLLCIEDDIHDIIEMKFDQECDYSARKKIGKFCMWPFQNLNCTQIHFRQTKSRGC